MAFEEVVHDNALVTFQSSLLRSTGVIHGFSTRCGGLSRPPRGGLDLAAPSAGAGEANTTIAANFRLLRAALGLPRHVRIAPRQMHAADVWRAPAGPIRPADAPDADAVITDHPDHMLVIRTADCVPVLLASGDGAVVAAVHAGWRGLVAGVIGAALGRLEREFAGPASRWVAAVGPAIGVDPYEVGPEVAQAFVAAGLAQAVRQPALPAHRPHVDLAAAARLQLLAAGVPEAGIDVCGRCTYAEPALFFSHRRDGAIAGGTGRMAAVIARRA